MTRISAQIVIGAAITPTRAPSTTLASSIECQDLSPTVIWSTQIKRNFQIQRKNLEMLDIIWRVLSLGCCAEWSDCEEFGVDLGRPYHYVLFSNNSVSSFGLCSFILILFMWTFSHQVWTQPLFYQVLNISQNQIWDLTLHHFTSSNSQPILIYTKHVQNIFDCHKAFGEIY